MRNVRAASVYVMQTDGRVKIGRAVSVEARRKQIQVSCANQVCVVYDTGHREDASYVEAAAHRILRDQCISGEWFNTSPADAIATVNAAVREVERWKDVARCRGCMPARMWLPLGRKRQMNLRVDSETLQALGDLMRADVSGPLPPTITDVFRRLVLAARDRLRHQTEMNCR